MRRHSPFQGFSFRLALVALALGGLAPRGSPGMQPEITATHEARSLQPGEIVVLRVRSPFPIVRLEGSVFGKSFPFYAEDEPGQWTGLIGIDLTTKPGKYTVRLRGAGKDGKSLALDHALNIVAKTFPTRRLTLDEKFVTPPPEVLGRIEREGKQVQAILSAVGPRRFWSGSFVAPVPGPPISEFGKRNILNGKPRSPHSGTDFRAAAGTPIRAPNAGTVVLAADLYYSGNTLIIDHGLGLYSYFAHLSAFDSGEGDKVKKGEIVGKVGATGRVTGPHLHWTVRLVGTRVDPLSIMSVLGKASSQGQRP